MSLQWAMQFANRYLGDHLDDHRAPETAMCTTWHYENGCVLKGVEQLWKRAHEERYLTYIKDIMDQFVDADGLIQDYKIEDYNLDQINEGKLLFTLWRETGESKYKEAIERLMTQMRGQPKTDMGGFWHKKIYPYQMWLDGVYMASPLLAAYGRVCEQPEWLDVAANQILTMERVARDKRTGLLYHAYDESREQRWANETSGCSPQFWGRAMGWFAMAIVDVLDDLPRDHAKRGQIVGIFHRFASAVVTYQDAETGLWSQVLDQPHRSGNYQETSCTAMFAYALAKGAKHGYLEGRFLTAAQRAFEGIVKHRIRLDDDGHPHLTYCNAVAGLGGKPYRDGSYEYYVGESVVEDDAKAVGPFILAALELEPTGEPETVHV